MSRFDYKNDSMFKALSILKNQKESERKGLEEKRIELANRTLAIQRRDLIESILSIKNPAKAAELLEKHRVYSSEW